MSLGPPSRADANAVRLATASAVRYVEYSVGSRRRIGGLHQHTNRPLAMNRLVLAVDQRVARVEDPGQEIRQAPTYYHHYPHAPYRPESQKLAVVELLAPFALLAVNQPADNSTFSGAFLRAINPRYIPTARCLILRAHRQPTSHNLSRVIRPHSPPHPRSAARDLQTGLSTLIHLGASQILQRCIPRLYKTQRNGSSRQTTTTPGPGTTLRVSVLHIRYWSSSS